MEDTTKFKETIRKIMREADKLAFLKKGIDKETLIGQFASRMTAEISNTLQSTEDFYLAENKDMKEDEDLE
jgi:hypothetical protein